MVLICKAIATSGCLTWRAETQLGLHSIRRKSYFRCGRLTAAASSSLPTDRARGTSIKGPRPARVKKNCYSRATLTHKSADWSADGRFIVYIVNDPKTKVDLWVLPLFGDQKPFPFLQTEANERGARFSPDGRWIAYISDESGINQIYVQSLPCLWRQMAGFY